MTHAKVEAVNTLLLAGEPENITVDISTGYTGYKPQSVIDAMNTVFWGEWGFAEVGSEIVPGDKGALAISQVQVWLAGLEFRPTSWGQNRVTRGDIGDARKGAQTDALKKALSYFSIGNRAYQGLLIKEESQGSLNGHSNPQNTRQRSAPGNAPKPLPAPQKPELSVDQLQALCDEICGKGSWGVVKATLFPPEQFGDLADEVLSAGQKLKIYDALEKRQRAKQAKAS